VQKDSGPPTVAEASSYRATSTSAEVVEFIDTVCQVDHLIRLNIGQSNEGRPLAAVIAANPPVAAPEELRDDSRLVALVIGNIHSGECAGKEALLRLLRELSQNPSHPLLKRMVLLILPNYNADANDRMGKDNRHSQIGPVDGMGRRHNTQGLDLNRDYVKLESPEAQALIGLMSHWNPHVFIDCHTTNGSWHRNLLTYATQHNPAADSQLGEFLRLGMMPEVAARLERKGVNTVWYGNYNGRYDRWYTYGHQPRYGLDYYALRGRIGILSEAYAHATYEERIDATHAFVGECLAWLDLHRGEVTKLTASTGTSTTDVVPIRAALAPYDTPILIRGYDPPSRGRITPEERASGERPAPPGDPKDRQVEYWGLFIPTRTVHRPSAYAIPPGLAAVLEKLRQHGIQLEELATEKSVDADVYRCNRLTHAERPFQGHKLATADVTPRREIRTLPAGTMIAPTNQPLGRLLVYLLEPESDDGLVTWNFFDETFQAGADFPVLRIR
jgi:dipeptidyl-peptidase 4